MIDDESAAAAGEPSQERITSGKQPSTHSNIANIIRSASKLMAPVVNLNEQDRMNPTSLAKNNNNNNNQAETSTTNSDVAKWKKKFNFTMKKSTEPNNNTESSESKISSPVPKPSIDEIRTIVSKDTSQLSIVLLDQRSFWLETPTKSLQIHRSSIQNSTSLLNIDQAAKVYRTEFIGCEHWNFTGHDKNKQRYVLSLILENDGDYSRYRTVLRSSLKMIHGVIDLFRYPQPMSVPQIFKAASTNLEIENFTFINSPAAPEEIAKYDEQSIANTFKFGVLYQKRGQVSEEEMYNNREMSEFFVDFMDTIAERITLKGYKGYNGELDTKFDLTGTSSYTNNFEGNQIMFHVSTLLPFNENDPQQIEKKRHIGNDIVALVLQEPGAKFCPNVINSQYLQVFVCLQLLNSEKDEKPQIKIQVTAKPEVSSFGPYLNESYTLDDPIFKRLLYSKLINAQIAACNSTGKIGSILKRRQEMLFAHLIHELEKEVVSKMKDEEKLFDESHVVLRYRRGGDKVEFDARKIRRRSFTLPGNSP